MSWAQNSAANLLPLSIERSRLAIALKEWLYTGDMYDLEEPVETCELCEHPDIRYQFKTRIQLASATVGLIPKNT
jgi:hypothetical protein